jgi:hypothetical protein
MAFTTKKRPLMVEAYRKIGRYRYRYQYLPYQFNIINNCVAKGLEALNDTEETQSGLDRYWYSEHTFVWSPEPVWG